VLVVDCLEATQLQRVMQRNGWPADQVQRVIAQQLPRAERRALADAVIFNEAVSLAQLQVQVRGLWLHWGGSAQAAA
jgi:dephospho-CoA kinase